MVEGQSFIMPPSFEVKSRDHTHVLEDVADVVKQILLDDTYSGKNFLIIFIYIHFRRIIVNKLFS